MAETSISIVLQAENRLTGPFNEGRRAVQAMSAELRESAASAREFVEANRTWSMEEMIGKTAEEVGTSRHEVSLLTREVGMLIPGMGRVGEVARSAFAVFSTGATGLLGPLGAVALGLSAVAGAVKLLGNEWDKERKQAKASLDLWTAEAKERESLLAGISKGAAEARGDKETDRQRRVRELREERQAIETRFQEMLSAEYASGTFGGTVKVAGREGEGSAAQLWKREAMSDWRARLADEERRSAIEDAKTQDEKDRRAWDLESKKRKGEDWVLDQFAGIGGPDKDATAKALEGFGGLTPGGYSQSALDFIAAWQKSMQPAGASYTPMRAQESMMGVRGGQDPYARLIAETERVRKAVEEVASNTKPTGSPSYKPSPVG